MNNSKQVEERYYTVEPEGKECPHCGLGEMWDVVGPDGVALGTSFGDRLSAQEYADDLDSAYKSALYRVQPPSPDSQPTPTEGDE